MYYVNKAEMNHVLFLLNDSQHILLNKDICSIMIVYRIKHNNQLKTNFCARTHFVKHFLFSRPRF